MNKKVSFSIEEFSIDENPSSHFAVMDMKIVSSGMNLHNLPITKEAVKKSAQTLFGKPVLTHYIPEKDSLGGHDEEQVPIGAFLDKNITIEEDQEKVWLSAKAYIWKKYFPEVMDVFKKNEGKTNISMEIEINDSGYEEDGYEWIKDYSFMGVTAIGVQPAIVGSGATVLQFSELVEEIKKDVFGKYDGISFKIPGDVKSAAEDGLKLRAKFKRGGTSVGLATARYLVKNSVATPEKVRHIAKYFPRHAGDNLDDKESNGWIAWQLWGGNAGRRWATSLVKRMNSMDERQLSRFAEGEEEVEDFAKEDLGKSEALKVDKSKDALSNRAWGSVNKGALRDAVLKASNYKSLVKDVYMLVEAGWEDAPSQHLKYPVMEISGGKLVYNRGGLSSALGYAKKENETEVVSKVNKIYKSLGLNEEEKMAKEEEKKDEAEEVEMAKSPAPEAEPENKDSEKEKQEEQQEGEEEKKKEGEMSLDMYADIPSMMAMLEEETDDMKKMAEEIKKPDADFKAISAGLYSMLKTYARKFSESKKSSDEKIRSLEKFKASAEKKQLEEKVQTVLFEVKEFISKEEKEKWAAKSAEFSIDTISEWEKDLKASLFNALKNSETDIEKETFTTRPFVYDSDKKNKKYIW